jgi:hypothetical protein
MLIHVFLAIVQQTLKHAAKNLLQANAFCQQRMSTVLPRSNGDTVLGDWENVALKKKLAIHIWYSSDIKFKLVIQFGDWNPHVSPFERGSTVCLGGE